MIVYEDGALSFRIQCQRPLYESRITPLISPSDLAEECIILNYENLGSVHPRMSHYSFKSPIKL